MTSIWLFVAIVEIVVSGGTGSGDDVQRAVRYQPWFYSTRADCERNRSAALLDAAQHAHDATSARAIAMTACAELTAAPVGETSAVDTETPVNEKRAVVHEAPAPRERAVADETTAPAQRTASASLSDLYLDSEADALDTMIRERSLLVEILADPRASLTAKAIAAIRLRDLNTEIARSRERMKAILERKDRLESGDRSRP